MYIDLETEMYLQKLEGDIRSQLYWGVVPEIPIEWQPDFTSATRYLCPHF